MFFQSNHSVPVLNLPIALLIASAEYMAEIDRVVSTSRDVLAINAILFAAMTDIITAMTDAETMPIASRV